ncbi:MAG: hypothetical protein Q9214_007761, partial [Letrouitia sp. 1 TL-2023]
MVQQSPRAPSALSPTAEDLPALLELEDGSQYNGYSFGANKSTAGELVFQTGMVGYPESITDPSYQGQILVVTFPLIGNYGVPSRQTKDDVVSELPAHFEASQIHIAGLIVSSYAGEGYSHYLASSSLGTWLKEQGVPTMYGVDTRALTKRIRKNGSMLGKLLLLANSNGSENVTDHALANGVGMNSVSPIQSKKFDSLDWSDPNKKNLVAV